MSKLEVFPWPGSCFSAAMDGNTDENRHSKIAPRTLACGIAGLLLCLGYGLNIYFGANSSLLYIPYVYKYSDMHANLLWAKSILEQGWLNPQPHHPYVDWMQAVGSYSEFVSWWGGEAIFQQSPLYTYFLAVFQFFSDDLLYVMIAQGAIGILLCVALGRIAFLMSGRAVVGWLALAIAGLYAPFYAYSFALLRDVPGWAITAWLLVALLELDRANKQSRRHRFIACGVGALLGLGYLARETFVVFIPVVIGILTWSFCRQKLWRSAACVWTALAIVIAPLVIRNAVVGAPLLSTSNRFAEVFIMGHARSAHPCLFVMPQEARSILEETEGKPIAVVAKTLASHESAGSWLRLEWLKALSLLDPFESPGNLNIEFSKLISPLVRYGLTHWMIIVPGIGGFILSVARRERRQFWLWVFFPLLLAGVLVALPLSRYRQYAMVLWIPWAAWLLVELIQPTLENHRIQARQWAMASLLIAGWALCLGPFARMPGSYYDRSTEYLLSIHIYQQLGLSDRAEEMARLLRAKFPEEQLRAEVPAAAD